jgi:uncharacterized RDD family membrane protein YckC
MSDWYQPGYQIPVSAQPAQPSPTSTPVAKSVLRVLAGPETRLIAVVIDVLINYSPLLAGWALTQRGEDHQTTAWHLRWWILSTIVIDIGQLTLLSLRGQTLGKMLMGVRIVDYHNNSNPGFVKAVLLRACVPRLIAAIPCVGTLFALIDPLFIFGEERRCIHDRIAGTKVVEV